MTCTWQNAGEQLEPYESLYADIGVEAEAGASLGQVENEVQRLGGEGIVSPGCAAGTGTLVRRTAIHMKKA